MNNSLPGIIVIITILFISFVAKSAEWYHKAKILDKKIDDPNYVPNLVEMQSE